MFLSAILLSGLSLLALLGGGYVVAKRLEYIEQNIAGFQEFFSPKGEGEASPFVDLIGQTGGYIAANVSENVQKSLAASIGGSMKGATAELERQALGDNPSLAILDGMPKSIKKNPLAFLAMQTLLNRHLPVGGGGAMVGGNHSGSQVKFDL